MKRAAAFLIYAKILALPFSESHQLQLVKREIDSVPFFQPQSNFDIFQVYTDNLSPISLEESVNIGKETLISRLNIKENELKIIRSYLDTNTGIVHIYANRVVNNYLVDNQVAAIHLINGETKAISSSFTSLKNIYPPVAFVNPDEAVKVAEDHFHISVSDTAPIQKYIQIPNGDLVFVHQFALKDDEEWMQINVDARSGQIIQVIDYSSNASYKAIALPSVSPDSGFTTLTDPQKLGQNPTAWQSDDKGFYSYTRGNNVWSILDQTGEYVEGDDNLNFSSIFDKNQSAESNFKAGVINTFYLLNTLHDIFYEFGFDEAAGNFQQFNFGKGGLGGDAVVVHNQAFGRNNARFLTPPDGETAEMRMYIWDKTSPTRDGSLDNTIPIHEFSHGLTNRLTGGPSQVGCLAATESKGLGEGWSDTFAVYLTRTSQNTRKDSAAVGAYGSNDPNGIRKYPYSIDETINPLTYKDIETMIYPHQIGTLWATMTFELYWNFVDRYGFTSNWYDSTQLSGNIMAMKNIITGLKLQPCSPSFINARDAIIAADQVNYQGKNKCIIWKAFSKRGLGLNSTPKYVNNYDLPTECTEELEHQLPLESTEAQSPFESNVNMESGKDLIVGSHVKVIFDASRLTKICDQFYLCVGLKMGQKKCIEIPKNETIKTLNVLLKSPGKNVVQIFSQGPVTCYGSDKIYNENYELNVLKE